MVALHRRDRPSRAHTPPELPTPALGNNGLTIDEGGSVVLDASMLSATDVDHPDAGLTFTVSSVQQGRFEEVANPGVAIASFTQAQLTAALYIGEATVKTHVSNLLQKLGARDRVAAVVYAHRHGLT